MCMGENGIIDWASVSGHFVAGSRGFSMLGFRLRG
jgi:hypothetical protein